jgi:hypothetical protein
MTKKIVDLKEYRSQKAIKKQIDTLDGMYDEYMVRETDPVIRKGYVNFMRLLKEFDKKYGEHNDDH